MKIRQVRNATLRVDYAATRFLIDPYLANKDAYPGFEGTANSHIRNPRVELETPLNEILTVDAVIVTHTHHDHWDDAAIGQVPKHLPLFAQHDADAELIRSQGFTDVRILSTDTIFNGVSLVKTPGRHGTEEAYAVASQIIGEVCGIVFRHADEKTLYVAGDTIWNDYVRSSLTQHKPDVVVLNAGDAQVPGLGSVIMGKEDVKKVHDAIPPAVTLIASHMEAINHCVLTRAELRDFADTNGISHRLLIPEDGEDYTY
jgi:L-ascorbate metabolism protein UlaG (beta-lactamase superfamily)